MCWCTAHPGSFSSRAYVIHLGPVGPSGYGLACDQIYPNCIALVLYTWIIHALYLLYLCRLQGSVRSVGSVQMCTFVYGSTQQSIYSTGVINSLWTAQAHKCTHLPGIFELLLWLGYDTLEILDKCLSPFLCPENVHTWKPPTCVELQTYVIPEY